MLSGAGMIDKQGSGTLVLNPSNASGYTGYFRVGSGGSVRFASAAALGGNAGTGTSSTLDLAGGLFEFRMDSPTLNKNVYSDRSGGGGTIFVDHALGSRVLNQTATFNTLTLSTSGSTTTTFAGRNGFGASFSGSANNTTTTSPEALVLTNNMNGLLSFAGSYWGLNDTTARTLTFNGTGDTLLGGGIIAAGAAHNFTVSGSVTVTLTGTLSGYSGSTYTGATSISGGTLAIQDFRAVNNAAGSGVINIGNSTTSGTLNIFGNDVLPANLTTAKIVNLAGTTGAATINASQTGTSPAVVFTSSFTATGLGSKTLNLGGANALDNEIRGAIGENSSTNKTSLAKNGSGTWLLTGMNTYTGTTTITAGTLKLQATATNSSGSISNIVQDASAITFNSATDQTAGGILEYVGLSTGSTEVVGTLTPTAGHGIIKITPGASGTTTLTFSGKGTRSTGATLNFTPGVGVLTLTSGAAVAGLYDTQAFATYNGVDWATIVGENIVALPLADQTLNLPTSGTTTLNYTDARAVISTSAAATINSLKLAPTATQTVTLGGVLTITSGGLLFDNSLAAATIINNGTVTNTLGGAAEIQIFINGSTPANALTVNARIGSGAAVLTKAGTGKLVVGGDNTFTGNVNLNEGTIRLSGATATLGASQAAVTVANLRQGTTLDLNGAGVGGIVTIGGLNGTGTITNGGGGSAMASTLVIGGTLTTAAGTFGGLLQDGAGKLSIVKGGPATGTAVQVLSGANTYTGSTTIRSGFLSVSTLANIGVDSGIGRGDSANNAASLIFAGTSAGTLSYTGKTSVSIDRQFTIAGAFAGLDASGTNSATVIFNSTADLTFAAGNIDAPVTLNLTGTSTGDNELRFKLLNNGTGALSLTKTGTGLWVLSNAGNSYTGNTTIAAGTLRADVAGAIPSTSRIQLGDLTTTGIFESIGSFTRSLSGTSNLVRWNGTTGGGGFAASYDRLVVALGGLVSPTALTWGEANFVGSGGTQSLFLNSATALSEVEFRNPVDLAGAVRTIDVADNTTTSTDFATISGNLSGISLSGINKVSAGTLQLVGANTYTGTTRVSAGTLVVTKLGNTSEAGGSSSVGLTTTADLSTSALILGAGGSTAVSLSYVGPGEISNRLIQIANTTGSTVFIADGSGPLVLTNVQITGAGAKTILLRGANTLGNMITSNLANSGGTLSLTHDTAGTWILTGDNSGMTGGVSFTGGAMGVGSDTAFGTGTILVNNMTFFAYGGDHIVSNSINHNGTGGNPVMFAGDYSLNFTGSWGNHATTANNALINNIVAGKTLTFADIPGDPTGSSPRTLTFDGTGTTIVNGVISSSTAIAQAIAVAGTTTLRLNGASTFTGPVTVGGGVLEFSTVSNNGGGPSNLGQGTDGINVGAGTLRFVGSVAANSPSTNRAITVTSSSAVLDASGTNGATVTYAGAIAATTNSLTLTGNVTGVGFLTGGLTQTGTTADLLVTGGTWNLATGTVTIGDDVKISGASTLVLGTAGVLTFVNGTDNFITVADGGTLKLGASGATAAALEGLLVGTETAGATANFDNGGFNFTAARFDLGGSAVGLSGNAFGTGTITATAMNLYRGTISAGLTGSGLVLKDGVGYVTLSGDNSGLTGTTRVTAGNLILSYAASNTAKMSATGTLDLRGGTLTLNGGILAATTQNVGGVTLASSGTASVAVNGGAFATTLNLQSVTRPTAGMTVRFSTAGGATITTTTANVESTGMLGWATISSGSETYFASNSAGTGLGNVAAVLTTPKNDVSTWLAADNVTDAGSGYFGALLLGGSVNSIRFDAAVGSTATIGNFGILTVAGGILVTDDVGAPAALNGGVLMSSSTELFIDQQSAFDFTIGSRIVGSPMITKSGAGTLVLTGNNAFSERLTINEGTVRGRGGNAIGNTSVVILGTDSSVMLDLIDQTETIDGLSGGGATGGKVLIGAGTLTLLPNATRIFGGELVGTGKLIKGGASAQHLSGANTQFTGDVIVTAGLLQLVGQFGSLRNAASISIDGGELLIDQDQTLDVDRIGDGLAITLNNTGGTRGLWMRTISQSALRTENIGTIVLGAGYNVIQSEASTGSGTGSSTVADLLADTLIRNNRATVLVRGLSLGATSSGARRGFIRFDAAATATINGYEVGGGGAAGSANISIIPWMIGDLATAGLGTSFVTYVDGTTGLRPLATTEYTTDAAGYNALSGASSNNVRFTTGATLTGSAAAINSLIVDSTTAQTITGPAGTLQITTGSILAAGAGSHVLGGFLGGLTTGGGRDYNVFVTTTAATFSITASLTSQVPLVKSGSGTLRLGNAANQITDVYLNQGAILIDDYDKLGSGSLNFFGGILRLDTGFSDNLGAKNFNVNTGGGTIDVQSLTNVTASGWTFTGSGTLTKVGSGTLTIGPSAGITHTGQVVVSEGTLILGNTLGNSIGVGGLFISGSSNPTIVRQTTDNQIADTATVALRTNGSNNQLWDLNGFSETIGGLSLTAISSLGVVVRTGATGVLTVNGDITFNADRNVATGTTEFQALITGSGSVSVRSTDGVLDLGGMLRTITVESVYSPPQRNDATIETVVRNGGIVKQGSRLLYLRRRIPTRESQAFAPAAS
ncbi:MAG: autotransporter-associated beta strand repeat-containing protein [Pirellulales bacterium]